SATVGAPLVKELKVGVSTPESWNDFKLPSLCLYVQHYLTNHYYCIISTVGSQSIMRYSTCSLGRGFTLLRYALLRCSDVQVHNSGS
ncbi:hypothetical protein BDN71DRAFT_1440142, partial [Pleurotus eryngii]